MDKNIYEMLNDMNIDIDNYKKKSSMISKRKS